ncbi:hypothetical protein D3C71_2097880 [compost metagenome]
MRALEFQSLIAVHERLAGDGGVLLAHVLVGFPDEVTHVAAFQQLLGNAFLVDVPKPRNVIDERRL